MRSRPWLICSVVCFHVPAVSRISARSASALQPDSWACLKNKICYFQLHMLFDLKAYLDTWSSSRACCTLPSDFHWCGSIKMLTHLTASLLQSYTFWLSPWKQKASRIREQRWFSPDVEGSIAVQILQTHTCFMLCNTDNTLKKM